MSETLVCEACGAEATKVTADNVDLCAECYEECIAEYVELMTETDQPPVSDSDLEAAGQERLSL